MSAPNEHRKPAVWLPTIRTNTGTDRFTETLASGLEKWGYQTEIHWLPPRAEFAPWTVPVPAPPRWANIVHVNTWLHPRFLPKTLPIVATIHHSIHHRDFTSHKSIGQLAYHRHWIAPIEREVMQRADQIVAVSGFAAETAKRTLINVPIEVVYNGIDLDIFKPSKRSNRPSYPFRLLYVGSWITRKGVHLLAPIMEQLGANFLLRFTGGRAADRMRRPLPANMHNIGHLQSAREVRQEMHRADALLFPSRSEGFGLVAVEAMACGLPVITTNGSSLLEIVENGKTGLLCTTDVVKEFAEAATLLMNHPDLWSEMSLRSQERVKESFTLQQMLRGYIAIYESLNA